jgi:hypothetical protein
VSQTKVCHKQYESHETQMNLADTIRSQNSVSAQESPKWKRFVLHNINIFITIADCMGFVSFVSICCIIL